MENKLSNGLSQKEKDAMDRKMQRLEDKMIEAKHRYDKLVSQYSELLEKRHPEKTAERIKETLYKAYIDSERSLEQILSYMAGEDDDFW